MLDLQLIHSPPHYVADREIQPIEVIESWGLCHHLACVVKYLARCGRKQEALKDLQKAEWYLTRELNLKSMCLQFCLPSQRYSIENILHDWQLSSNLSNVLFKIYASQVQLITTTPLTQALKFLKSEITFYEDSRQ